MSQLSNPRRRSRALEGGGRLFKSSVAAAVATGADFLLVVALVSSAGVPAAAATALGCVGGAAINFSLNRVWTFRSFGPLRSQVPRYALVSFASLLLNACGVLLLADVAHLDYRLAWWLVRGAVFVGWNYMLHRNYVFR